MGEIDIVIDPVVPTPNPIPVPPAPAPNPPAPPTPVDPNMLTTILNIVVSILSTMATATKNQFLMKLVAGLQSLMAQPWFMTLLMNLLGLVLAKGSQKEFKQEMAKFVHQ